MLAESPVSDPLHGSVSAALLPPPPPRLLPAGTTSCRARIALAENLRLSTAHHVKQPRVGTKTIGDLTKDGGSYVAGTGR